MLRPVQLKTDELRSAIAPLFEENFARFGELGAAVSIWQHGQPLLDLHDGCRDAQRQTPWDARTIVPLWPATKGLASAWLLHALQEHSTDPTQKAENLGPEFPQGRTSGDTRAQSISEKAGLAALDSSVVFHEFTHGLSNRLVGGPANDHTLDAIQSGSMG